MSYIEINNLGSFANINALWSAYPEGGHEGDYCTIGSVKYHWDKYDRMWVASPNYGPTPGRKTETFDGDVTILNNLTVAGTIHAKGIKSPSQGLYATEEDLTAACPDPEVGMWAVVGDTMPGAIYRCSTAGQWSPTGQSGGVDDIDLTDYVHKQDMYDVDEFDSDDLVAGYYYIQAVEDEVLDTIHSSEIEKCLKLKVYEGDTLIISTFGRTSARAWALTDIFRFILSEAADNEDSTVTHKKLTVTQRGYLYVNCRTTSLGSFFVKRYHSSVDSQISVLEENVASFMRDVEYDDLALTKKRVWANYFKATPTENRYVPEDMGWNNNCGCMVLEVVSGDTVTVKSQVPADAWNTVPWGITDTNRRIIESAPHDDDPVSVTLNIEVDGYVFINCSSDYYSTFEVTHHCNTIANDIDELKDEISRAGKSIGVVEVAGATPTQVLTTNTYYKFTGAITSLTATLGAAASGILNIYAFSFTAGKNSPTINLPPNVAVDTTVTIMQGDHVEYTIINNVAACKVWRQTT